MKYLARTLSIAMLAMAAGPVSAGSPAAADWWLVSGAPSDSMAIFADATTLSRHGQSAQLEVLRIDRSGRTYATLQQIRCNRGSGSAEGEAVRVFACASDKDRDEHGLILAAIRPDQMARMIFNTPTVDIPELGLEPRT